VVKLILWAQASPLDEVMQSCKFFPLESKMPTLNQVFTFCDVLSMNLTFWQVYFMY